MRLDFFVKLKKWSSTIILPVSIKHFLRDLLFDVNYSLAYKVAMCVTYCKWCQRSLWHQLDLSSCEFHIPKPSIRQRFMYKFIWFPYFLFFWFSILILSYSLILPMSQLQTQQLLTSQIRSHIECLRVTNYIAVFILHSKLMRNVAALAVLIRFSDDSW